MMYYIILLFNLLFVNNQSELEKSLYVFVTSSIVQDMYFFLDFEKDDLPRNLVYYSNAMIEKDSKNQYKENFLFENITTLEKANYIMFSSKISKEGKVKIEVFLRRNSIFNTGKGNDYNKMAHFNSSILYEIQLDENWKILLVKKSAISYH